MKGQNNFGNKIPFLVITTKFYLSNFRTLPMPRKGAAPPNLYMSWLEIMTRKMPPFLLVSFYNVPKLVKMRLNWSTSTTGYLIA